MTREEAKLKVWKAHCNFYDPRKAINIVIEQIFNDHEAQLNAKDEEIEVLHSHLKTIDEDYSALASDFESAVMEIDRLKDTK